MGGDRCKQYERARGLPANADEEDDTSNPPRSKFSEGGQARVGSGFSLGPGLGSIPRESLNHIVSFHGCLSTGTFIGLQMLALGRRLLDIKENERIHVLCETTNCLPDAFQALAGATTGNRGLIIRDTGKMLVTITRHMPPGKNATGIRIVLDAKKTRKFDKLHAWYMNREKVPHREVVRILREAGDAVYSYEYVKVPVTRKREKHVTICRICGEAFIQKAEGDSTCLDCAREEGREGRGYEGREG